MEVGEPRWRTGRHRAGAGETGVVGSVRRLVGDGAVEREGAGGATVVGRIQHLVGAGGATVVGRGKHPVGVGGVAMGVDREATAVGTFKRLAVGGGVGAAIGRRNGVLRNTAGRINPRSMINPTENPAELNEV